MPEQLKIIIDADVQGAVSGFEKVAASAGKLTSIGSQIEKGLDFNSGKLIAQITELQAKLKTLKVSPVDVTVNTSGLDTTIKNIQAKFESLTDPKINVLANTTQAEAAVKELIGELTALKGSEIFIRANDSQALKVINEVEAELNSLVGKKIDLKVSADLAKIDELKAKIASIKVSPVDVSVNTSTIDAAIKRIQDKFNTLVDPKINVLANTVQAEASIKDLISELSTLKGSEIFIRANDSQALKAINEIEAELNSLVGKQIKINVDTLAATERINVLESELLALNALKISPEVTATQIELFEANIQRLKNEIAGLKGEGIVVPINVNTAPAERNVNELTKSIEQLKSRIATVKSFIEVETDITKVVAYNKEIEKLENQVKSLQNVGKKGFEIFVVPNQAIQSVKSLKDAVAAFGGGVKTFIPPAISSFSKLSPAINSAANSLQKFPSAANASSLAMLNFGRVIQDAPFGILGIANNLNPLIESLGRASAAAKETGTSLAKNLVGSLSGAAGIGLVVSLVSSAAIVFSNFFRTTKDGSEDLSVLKERFDSLASSIDIAKENIDLFKGALDFGSEFFTIGQSSASVLNIQRQQQSKLIEEIKIQAGQARTAVIDLMNSTNTADLSKEAFKEFQNTLKESQKKVRDIELQQINEEGRLLIINRKLQEQYFDDVKALREKALADFEKFQNEVIAKAKQFSKEFGKSFVVPELEESFFVNKNEIFKRAQKLLSDVKTGNLKIKLPVLTDFEFIPEITTPLTEAQIQELTKGFFEGIRIEKGIPVEVIPDVTLDKSFRDKIEQKLDLKQKFSILGAFGDKEFDKIFKNINTLDFSALNKGIEEATKRLRVMMETALTLNEAIGQGLVNSFNSVFDAILEGKSVFRALGEAIKQLVIGTIKAVAQMLILKAVTNLLIPGAGSVIPIPQLAGISRGRVGGQANFGTGGIGGRAFNNVLTVNVVGQVSGSQINLVSQRAANSAGRGG